MKKKLIHLIGVGLSIVALAGCSGNTSQSTTESTSTTTTSQSSTEVTYTTYQANSERFSVELPEGMTTPLAAKVDNVLGISYDALELQFDYPFYGVYLYRDTKADLTYTIDQYVDFVLDSSTLEEMNSATPEEATIAGKKGYRVEEEVRIDSVQYNYSIFVYEDGDFFKQVLVQKALDSDEGPDNATLEEKVVSSWKDVSVTPSFDLSQSVTFPNTSLTMKIPADWTQDTSITENPYYQNKYNNFRVGIGAQVIEEGYTVDLADYANQLATEFSSEATTEPVTIGANSGYLVHFIETDEEGLVKIAYNHYILMVGNTVTTTQFICYPSDEATLKLTMEAMLATIQ